MTTPTTEPTDDTCEYSALWGANGEHWSPRGKLPDFSHAGYHSGNDPIPHVPLVKNIQTDYGAVGDGETDDSDAFLQAVADAPMGAIYLPAGRYKITKVIQITRPGIVLRGEGMGKSVLFFPEPLLTAAPKQRPDGNWNFQKILSQPEHPKADREPPFTPDGEWRFRGAFLWVEGEDKGEQIADVTGIAQRGDTTLTLSSVSHVRAGQFVRLLQFDDAGRTLGRYLHGDLIPAGAQTYDRVTAKFVDFVARVVAVDGNTVTLDRPLRVDVRPEWSPQVWSYAPTVEEVGIEDLTFEFAGEPYPGHLKEHGFNATYFKQCANCWMKNVETVDADIAFNFEWAVRFSQIEDVRTRRAKRDEEISKSGGTGHHAVQFAYLVQDCLFTRFRFDTHMVHDITVDSLPSGNVFSQGSGIAVNFDHHRGIPYDNLFSDIDLGLPDLCFVSSGQPQNGARAGMREVFWNVRASEGESLPPPPHPWDASPERFPPPPGLPPTWPDAVFVGLQGWERFGDWAKTTPAAPGLPRSVEETVWIEGIAPDRLIPQDLHAAQVAARRQRA